MKFALIAAIATYALAYDPQTDIPDRLSEEVTLRWSLVNGKKVGTNAYSKRELKARTSGMATREGKRTCKRGAKQFDKYCHQYMIDQDRVDAGRIPKYANFKSNNGEGECAFTDRLEQLACLGQDCMFDYCIHRREEFLDACIANEGDQARDDWGNVYDFGEMHGDLQSNGGDWPNATCDAYYVLRDQLQADGTFDQAGY